MPDVIIIIFLGPKPGVFLPPSLPASFSWAAAHMLPRDGERLIVFNQHLPAALILCGGNKLAALYVCLLVPLLMDSRNWSQPQSLSWLGNVALDGASGKKRGRGGGVEKAIAVCASSAWWRRTHNVRRGCRVDLLCVPNGWAVSTLSKQAKRRRLATFTPVKAGRFQKDTEKQTHFNTLWLN